MPVSKPRVIGDSYQIPFTVAADKKFKKEPKPMSVGTVQVSEDGVFTFPQPRWIALSCPKDGMLIELSTDEQGNLDIGPHVQPGKSYIIKFGSIDKSAETVTEISATASTSADITEVATFVILKVNGPNKAGMFQKQVFPAVFPGILGAATFDAGARLSFQGAEVSVEIEVSGFGIDTPKKLTVKPTGLVLRSVGMLQREPAVPYEIKVFKPGI